MMMKWSALIFGGKEKLTMIWLSKDPLFGGTFDGSLEELHFKKPSMVRLKRIQISFDLHKLSRDGVVKNNCTDKCYILKGPLR